MPGRPTMRRSTWGGGLPLVLALALVAPGEALARWQGIDREDNRILFAGGVPGADREGHRHRRFEDTGGKYDSYEAYWMARGRRVPLLRLRLHRKAPGEPYRLGDHKTVEHAIRNHRLFGGLAYKAIESGDAETALGPAEYLVFEAGRYRCGTWRLYRGRRAGHPPDALGDTLMTGLYCPVSRGVDAGRLAALLARTGIGGVAEPEAVAAPPAPRREEVLARLAKSGDMAGLRRIAARGLDPDSVIPFSRPRFAGGRTLRRPMIVAAALFGHVEMTVFLLELGAATGGDAASAICAAVAGNHTGIVAALLESDPGLAWYGRCGRDRSRTALDLARRPGRAAILELLQAARAR